ncbi:hypothetical protein BCR32DRAFT_277832 [Anaeromyces robustus]|uniref:Uncharacterized protein n=1 Tax=Anaeromyces robustus TaxID=1754192 RepID=A0A1Y1XD53_9FUNG|nr:hypothetical protein BCR32DRAFT_277832 [Anaeromyces robustus]|eukprot:ORX83669.1 hypothetical protein BCR32DRAFT_277832 [Anaeromyces robustus]
MMIILDLEGNLDLHGYVPLYPNLNNCNFDITDLCYLPDATCKSEDMDECTEAEIKSTNIENENPNPNSDEYENHSKSKESFNESTIKYILIFIIVVIVIIGTICLFKKYDCSYQENINNNYRYRPTERNTNRITVQRTQITELRLNYN